MFRPAARVLARAPGVAVRGPAGRRLISTAPTDTKSRSWKNTAVRLGLAVGAVYYYNTSNVFSEQASFSLLSKQNQPESPDESSLPTLNSIKPRIRKERETEAAAKEVPKSDAQQPTQHEPVPASASAAETALNSPQDLEDEASHEAAFNPETGEINWDCPCLGGMAHGPCGEEFKAAFSCFVYSTEEPKGMDCIDKFKGMQECFRKYPEVYGAELEDDEEAAAVAAPPDGGEQPESVAEIDASYAEVKQAESQEPIPAAETTGAPQTEK